MSFGSNVASKSIRDVISSSGQPQATPPSMQDNIQEKRGALMRIIDTMQVGQYPIAGFVRGLARDDLNPIQGMLQGLASAQPFVNHSNLQNWRHSYSDVLGDLGWEPETTGGKIAKGAAGFVGDVLLDPTTYYTFGLSGFLKGTGRGAAAAAGIGERLTEKTAKSIVRADLKKRGIKLNKEQFYSRVDALMRNSDKASGFRNPTTGITMSLKNLPFGERLFPNAGVKEFMSADRVAAIGDRNLAPIYGAIRTTILGSRLGKLFSTTHRLHIAAKESPEQLLKAMDTLFVEKNLAAAKSWDVASTYEVVKKFIPDASKKLAEDIYNVMSSPHKLKELEELRNSDPVFRKATDVIASMQLDKKAKADDVKLKLQSLIDSGKKIKLDIAHYSDSTDFFRADSLIKYQKLDEIRVKYDKALNEYNSAVAKRNEFAEEYVLGLEKEMSDAAVELEKTFYELLSDSDASLLDGIRKKASTYIKVNSNAVFADEKLPSSVVAFDRHASPVPIPAITGDGTTFHSPGKASADITEAKLLESSIDAIDDVLGGKKSVVFIDEATGKTYGGSGADNNIDETVMKILRDMYGDKVIQAEGKASAAKALFNQDIGAGVGTPRLADVLNEVGGVRKFFDDAVNTKSISAFEPTHIRSYEIVDEVDRSISKAKKKVADYLADAKLKDESYPSPKELKEFARKHTGKYKSYVEGSLEHQEFYEFYSKHKKYFQLKSDYRKAKQLAQTDEYKRALISLKGQKTKRVKELEGFLRKIDSSGSVTIPKAQSFKDAHWASNPDVIDHIAEAFDLTVTHTSDSVALSSLTQEGIIKVNNFASSIEAAMRSADRVTRDARLFYDFGLKISNGPNGTKVLGIDYDVFRINKGFSLQDKEFHAEMVKGIYLNGSYKATNMSLTDAKAIQSKYQSLNKTLAYIQNSDRSFSFFVEPMIYDPKAELTRDISMFLFGDPGFISPRISNAKLLDITDHLFGVDFNTKTFNPETAIDVKNKILKDTWSNTGVGTQVYSKILKLLGEPSPKTLTKSVDGVDVSMKIDVSWSAAYDEPLSKAYDQLLDLSHRYMDDVPGADKAYNLLQNAMSDPSLGTARTARNFITDFIWGDPGVVSKMKYNSYDTRNLLDDSNLRSFFDEAPEALKEELNSILNDIYQIETKRRIRDDIVSALMSDSDLNVYNVDSKFRDVFYKLSEDEIITIQGLDGSALSKVRSSKVPKKYQERFAELDPYSDLPASQLEKISLSSGEMVPVKSKARNAKIEDAYSESSEIQRANRSADMHQEHWEKYNPDVDELSANKITTENFAHPKFSNTQEYDAFGVDVSSGLKIEKMSEEKIDVIRLRLYKEVSKDFAKEFPHLFETNQYGTLPKGMIFRPTGEGVGAISSKNVDFRLNSLITTDGLADPVEKSVYKAMQKRVDDMMRPEVFDEVFLYAKHPAVLQEDKFITEVFGGHVENYYRDLSRAADAYNGNIIKNINKEINEALSVTDVIRPVNKPEAVLNRFAGRSSRYIDSVVDHNNKTYQRLITQYNEFISKYSDAEASVSFLRNTPDTLKKQQKQIDLMSENLLKIKDELNSLTTSGPSKEVASNLAKLEELRASLSENSSQIKKLESEYSSMLIQLEDMHGIMDTSEAFYSFVTKNAELLKKRGVDTEYVIKSNNLADLTMHDDHDKIIDFIRASFSRSDFAEDASLFLQKYIDHSPQVLQASWKGKYTTLSTPTEFEPIVRMLNDHSFDWKSIKTGDDFMRIVDEVAKKYESPELSARFLQSEFLKAAKNEHLIGKMSADQLDTMKDRIPLILESGVERVLKAAVKDVDGRATMEFGAKWGFGRSFNPFAEFPELLKDTIRKNPGIDWEKLATPEEYNAVFDKIFGSELKGMKVFKEDLTDIYLARMHKHSDLMYDNQLMESMVDMVGSKYTSGKSIGVGESIGINFGKLKKVINLNIEAAIDTQRKLDIKKHLEDTDVARRVESIISDDARWLEFIESRGLSKFASKDVTGRRILASNTIVKEELNSFFALNKDKYDKLYKDMHLDFVRGTGNEGSIYDIGVPIKRFNQSIVDEIIDGGGFLNNKFLGVRKSYENLVSNYANQLAGLKSDIEKFYNIPSIKTLNKSQLQTPDFARYDVDGVFADKIKRLNDANVKIRNFKDLDNSFTVMSDLNMDSINLSRALQMEKDSNFLLDLYDKGLHFAKLNMTAVSPAFHTVNKVGNMFNSMLGVGSRILSPSLNKKVWSSIGSGGKSSDEVADIYGAKHKLSKLYSEATNMSVFDESYHFSDLGAGTSSKGIGGDRIPGKYNPTNTKEFILYDVGTKVGSRVEQHDRFLHYVIERMNGKSMSAAADSTAKSLFDYGDLTSFERRYMKRLFPFYTWMKKNSMYQLEMMLEKPEVYRNFGKLFQSIEDMTAPEDRFEKRHRQDWISDWLQLPGTFADGKVPMMKLKLPMNDMERSPFLLSPTGALKSLGGQLTPFLKVPIEQISGKNLAFDSPMNTGVVDHVASQNILYNSMKGIVTKDGARDKALHALGAATGFKTLAYDKDRDKKMAISRAAEKYEGSSSGSGSGKSTRKSSTKSAYGGPIKRIKRPDFMPDDIHPLMMAQIGNKFVKDAGIEKVYFDLAKETYGDGLIKGFAKSIMPARPDAPGDYTGTLAPISASKYDSLTAEEKKKYTPPTDEQAWAYHTRAVELAEIAKKEAGVVKRFSWMLLDRIDPPKEYKVANVTRVIDGDTFVVDIGGEEHRVRPLLIDSPEITNDMPLGAEAKDFANNFLIDKDVRLIIDGTQRDQYGRLVAYVELDGQDFNEKMLEKGLAKFRFQFDDYERATRYLEAERKAYESKEGIWSKERYSIPGYDMGFLEAVNRELGK